MGSLIEKKEVHHHDGLGVFILVVGILWFFFRGDPDIADTIHELLLAYTEYVQSLTGS